MKKVSLFLSAVALVATISSCSKEYTCECSGTGITSSTTTAEFKKKADAEAWCNKSYSSGGATITCKLK